MKLKLFLLLTMLVSASALWAQTGVQGTVIDAKSGLPVVGATVMLDNQGNTVTTGPSGDFLISDAQPGSDVLLVIGYGYKDCETKVEIPAKGIFNVGVVRLTSSSFNPAQSINDDQADLVITESQLEDEEGNTQAVATLSGASDNPFIRLPATTSAWRVSAFVATTLSTLSNTSTACTSTTLPAAASTSRCLAV